LGGLFQERRNIVAQESRPNQIDTLQDLALELRRFADERDWEVYHTPKNLASALIVEAAELLEHFQWLSQEESRNLTPATREAVAHEIADVLIYLTRLADQLGIDMLAAAAEKMALNALKYPASSPE
jgi:NTP pyrophosphatase (non-canonical NTP hydrolase)